MVKTLLSCLICAVLAAPAHAQQPPPQSPPGTPPGGGDANERFNVESDTGEFQNGHQINCGGAVYEPPTGIKFFADCIDYDSNTHRIVARGNVVFTNADGRIAAETVEFNVETGVGTFHEASGLMSLGAKADRKQFGNQDPDVYFFGKTIEKVGPRKYHIT